MATMRHAHACSPSLSASPAALPVHQTPASLPAAVLACGVVERVQSWAKFKATAELQKASGGKKAARFVSIPKLDDANYAGLVATLDGPPPLDPASPAYAAAIAAHPAGERYTYVPGQVIGADDRTTNLPFDPTTEWSWSLTLKGVPQPGDTYAVDVNPYPQLNADNAQAMLDLRDLPMFDGGPLTDGYASAIAVIGTRILSAQSAAAVSADIASNLEKERTSIQGVNLDEEAARLIQFQQAYQASGKMMQVAQTIFDTLIDSIGR